ncbi:MAG: hypothetical protein ABI411_05385 [Tahibacter sp.]
MLGAALIANVAIGAEQIQTAADGGVIAGMYRGGWPVAKFDISPPLRSMTPIAVPSGPLKGSERELEEMPSGLEWLTVPNGPDPVVQSRTGPLATIPNPLISFDAQSNIGGVNPPDPVGDVGPNHYVAMANSSFQIFNKSGVSVFGPVNINTLWSGFGGACQTENSGDPVVLYDQLADRWLITQFTSAGPNYFNCVALSQSGDPTGAYYRYAFTTGTNFPDYPKYGVWADAYYISTREFAQPANTFAGVGAYAINRTQMLAGNPNPTVVSFLVPPGAAPFNTGDGLLPADLDGLSLPPGGSPEYYMGSMDAGGPYSAPQDALTLWKFTVNFTTPASSSFALASTIPTATMDTVYPCTPTARECLPQQGTATKIDILSYRQRPLHRLAYRNFGDHESLVTNQSVEAAASLAGIRWWEVRSPNATPSIFQEGTYAPGVTDGVHRWNASAAMDSSGNIGMGFSATSPTMFPSIWYTGRLSGDTPGTMPQGEGVIMTGTGSNTAGGNRWGDYTSINLDPTDDCTFWYVNQYTPVTSASGWRLRVGSFRFNQCGSPTFFLSATPPNQSVCVGATVSINVAASSIQSFNSPVTLTAGGNPAGTTAVFGTNPITPLPGSSTLAIGNTAAVPAGTYTIAIGGTAAGPINRAASSAVTFQVPLGAAPTTTAPLNGATGQLSRPTLTWTAVAGANTYTVEVATDPSFVHIIANATVATPSWQVTTSLAGNSVYFWRVRANNGCGSSSNSARISFTTANVACVGPLTIPDNNATGISGDVVLPAGLPNVSGLHVSVKATHTYIGDLVIRLTHGAAGADIINRPINPGGSAGNCSGDNMDASFFDAAAGVANTCATSGTAMTGSIKPNQAFSVFDGASLSGTWTVTASDRANTDTGTATACLELPAGPVDSIFPDGFE